MRNGKNYCSPGCGRGCTYKEYGAATRKAKELQRIMGSGWAIRVWENLGWHYELTHGPVGLFKSEGNGKYYAMISNDPNKAGGGLSFWTEEDHGGFTDPKMAVRSAIKYMQSVLQHSNMVLQAAIKATA